MVLGSNKNRKAKLSESVMMAVLEGTPWGALFFFFFQMLEAEG